LSGSPPGGDAPPFRRRIGWGNTKAIIVALTVPTLLAAMMFALACWISTLPVISPVSLSLVFRSWTRVFEYTFGVWFLAFVCLAPGCFLLWYIGRDE
jgi:hypothetical protein